MDKSAKIYIAGHKGLVGSSVVRELEARGYNNLLTRARAELDLLDSGAVHDFFMSEKPQFVIDCAARVGGIKANMAQPAEFLYENIHMQNNMMWSAKEAGVEKFLFVGSAVVYPSDSPQPMQESYVLQGPPEAGNQAYALSKIIGLKLCEYIHQEYGMKFISCLPTNLYGENSNFDPETANVIPALIRRIHEAKINKTPEVVIWGSGNSRRDFLYANDLTDALLWLMDNYEENAPVNVGSGGDISIKELATTIKHIVGYDGELQFDTSKPDGVARRLLDVTRIKQAGWEPKVPIEEGLRRTYDWYLQNVA